MMALAIAEIVYDRRDWKQAVIFCLTAMAFYFGAACSGPDDLYHPGSRVASEQHPYASYHGHFDHGPYAGNRFGLPGLILTSSFLLCPILIPVHVLFDISSRTPSFYCPLPSRSPSSSPSLQPQPPSSPSPEAPYGHPASHDVNGRAALPYAHVHPEYLVRAHI